MVRVVFVHPDLGIGGAERLVVDAALALKRKGHEVQFFTAHHDHSHAFPETTDGQLKVTCVGDWLPRSTFGMFAAFWAYIRMIYVALFLVFFSGLQYDVTFVDQISACIPFIKLKSNSKVLFYCHFPDQLLTQRKSVLKKIYRFFIDCLEETTTNMADKVLVNSKFTAEIFRNTFKSINFTPSVLYPSLDFEKFDKSINLILSDIGIHTRAEYIFLSLNRYERKKNIGLAIKAFQKLSNSLGASQKENIHLVIAGGYDNRVSENIEHYKELCKLSEDTGLTDQISFLKSPSDKIKVGLLQLSTCLIYTPDNEHFGIVPIEAMYCKTPVIAVNSGGPKETVKMNETGFLCKQEPDDFANAMKSFVDGISSKRFMAESCRQRVIENFSFDAFSEHLSNIVQCMMEKDKIK